MLEWLFGFSLLSSASSATRRANDNERVAEFWKGQADGWHGGIQKIHGLLNQADVPEFEKCQCCSTQLEHRVKWLLEHSEIKI